MYHLEDGSTTFNKEKGFNPFSVPCGQCLGCRIDHSRDWALRCIHHSKQYEKNCFVTFTFNEQNLQGRKSVRTKDFTDFAKRFRRYLDRKGRPPIEYFHSTEYGDKRSRPHHHAIIFNYFPPDAVVLKNVNGNLYYTSKELSKFWHDQGFIVVGELTYQSAAYTASYTFKKQRGKDYPEGISPEKMTCSQGIGIPHFLRYYRDYCSLGYILHEEKKYRIPRAYLKRLSPTTVELDLIKSNRFCLLPEYQYRYDTLLSLKLERELNSREDSILDRERKYAFLIENQKRYKKKLYEDSALSDDNRYLKQLNSLRIQIMKLAGEFNPQKQEYLYESVRRF